VVLLVVCCGGALALAAPPEQEQGDATVNSYIKRLMKRGPGPWAEDWHQVEESAEAVKRNNFDPKRLMKKSGFGAHRLMKKEFGPTRLMKREFDPRRLMKRDFNPRRLMKREEAAEVEDWQAPGCYCVSMTILHSREQQAAPPQVPAWAAPGSWVLE
jgi:hypothetical protein